MSQALIRENNKIQAFQGNIIKHIVCEMVVILFT